MEKLHKSKSKQMGHELSCFLNLSKNVHISKVQWERLPKFRCYNLKSTISFGFFGLDRRTTSNFIGDHKNFRLDSEFNREPVETNQNSRHWRTSGEPGQWSRNSILGHLYMIWG